MAPTHVLAMDMRFMGVYTAEYRTKLAAPRTAVSGFTAAAKRAVPLSPVTVAKDQACRGDTALRTKILFRVRDI